MKTVKRKKNKTVKYENIEIKTVKYENIEIKTLKYENIQIKTVKLQQLKELKFKNNTYNSNVKREKQGNKKTVKYHPYKTSNQMCVDDQNYCAGIARNWENFVNITWKTLVCRCDHLSRCLRTFEISPTIYSAFRSMRNHETN